MTPLAAFLAGIAAAMSVTGLAVFVHGRRADRADMRAWDQLARRGPRVLR